MSATVKLAKEIDELDISQPTAECHLMAWPYKRRLVTRRDELPPVQGEQKTPMSVSRRRTLRCAMVAKSLPWRKDMTSNA